MKIIEDDTIQELTMWNIDKAQKFTIEMSCFQDRMCTTYKNIVKVFGKETIEGDGYKVQAEWHVVTPAGFATIYDYKEGKQYCGKEGIPKTQVTNWHIGGATPEVVPYILKALKIKIK
jgi:hypothetical protein